MGKNYRTNQQNIIEYVIVALLIAVVLAIALSTLGESKEDYIDNAETVENEVQMEDETEKDDHE